MQIYLTSKTADPDVYCGVTKGWSNVKLMALYESFGDIILEFLTATKWLITIDKYLMVLNI